LSRAAEKARVLLALGVNPFTKSIFSSKAEKSLPAAVASATPRRRNADSPRGAFTLSFARLMLPPGGLSLRLKLPRRKDA